MTTREINERTEQIRGRLKKRREAEQRRILEHQRMIKEAAELSANDILDIFAFMADNIGVAETSSCLKIIIKVDIAKSYVDIEPKNEKVYEYQPAIELCQRVNLEVLEKMKEYFGEESQIRMILRKNVQEWMQCWYAVAEFEMKI